MSLEFFVDFAACAPVCKGWAHIDYYDNEKVIETYYSECEAGFDIVTPARKSSRCLELRTSCAKQQVHQGPWPLITTFAQSSESRRACRRCPTRNVFPVSPLKLWHVEAVPADPKRYCSGIGHTTITCPLTCTLAYCAAHIGAWGVPTLMHLRCCCCSSGCRLVIVAPSEPRMIEKLHAFQKQAWTIKYSEDPKPEALHRGLIRVLLKV